MKISDDQIDSWGYYQTQRFQRSSTQNYLSKLLTLTHKTDKKDWWHNTLQHDFRLASNKVFEDKKYSQHEREVIIGLTSKNNYRSSF